MEVRSSIEFTGLALGVAALPSAIDGCLSLYRTYCDSKKYDNALQYYAIDFQIQRARFASIAKVLQNHHINLDEHRGSNATGPLTFIQSYLDVTSRQLKQSSEHISEHSKSQGNMKRLKWTISDKGDLEDTLKRLTHLNSEMLNILPAAEIESICWKKELAHQNFANTWNLERNLELGKGKYATHVLVTPKTCGNYAATAIQLPNMRKLIICRI